MNVVCFKWGTLFGPEYVNKLYNSIIRNTTIPINFICFTDNDKGVICETRPFIEEVPDWWYIIGLHNPEHGFVGQTIYLDLDTVILKNIDDILSLDTDFAILRDYYRPNGLQTAMISWKPSKTQYIWEKFKNYKINSKNQQGGTNGFIERNVDKNKIDIYQDIFPEQMLSYKVNIRNKNLSSLDKARMVFFHGLPRPHEVKDNWLINNWK